MGSGYSRPEKPVGQWCSKFLICGKGSVFAEYQPGDGTRYSLLVTNIDNDEACKAIGCSPGSMLVTLTNHDRRSMFVCPGDCLHYSYIQEKLGVPTSSAVTLAIIIAGLTKSKAMTWDEFEKRMGDAA